MAQYTTGELAKLCNVSVRTVQYYDQADLLKPASLTENGRRLYGDAQVQTLKVILGYKQLGFSLKAIQKVMASQASTDTLALLVEQQLNQLVQKETDLANQKAALQFVLQSIQNTSAVPFEMTISDIEDAMAKTTQLKRLHRRMLMWGLLIDGVEIGLLILGFLSGIWWPMWIWIPIIIAMAIYVTTFYYQETVYLCPNCKTVFKPRLSKMFFARHTPKTRQLVCPSCGQKNYCIEQSA